VHRWYAVVAATGVILAALYLLWAYQRTFHGSPRTVENERFRDLNVREGGVLALFIVGIVFLGVYPKPMIDRIEPAVDRLLAHVEQQAAGEPEQPPAGAGVEEAPARAGEAELTVALLAAEKAAKHDTGHDAGHDTEGHAESEGHTEESK
jgi:NADH-quinone oxidoreductase subunit M